MSDESLTIDHSDDEIASTWKDIQARHSIADDAPEPEAKAATPEAPTEPVEAETAAQRARDEQGRFAKQAAEAAEVAAEPATQETPAQVAQATPERDINIAPSSWKPAAKVKWAALDPEIRAEVMRRESDFLRGQHDLLPDAQMGRQMRQVIEPYRMLIESEGGTPERAVQSLLQTARLFRLGTPAEKQNALLQIAQQYGIPFPQSAQSQIGAEGEQAAQIGQYRDPRVDQMIAEQQRREQYRAQQEEQQIVGAIDAWQRETDPKGQPLRPFYANVYDEMLAMLPGIRQAKPQADHREVLEEAYQRAVWANPETRQLLVKQQQDEAEAKRREENLRVAANAKKAASVNVPRRGVAPAPAKPGSMDDTIREAARSLGLMS